MALWTNVQGKWAVSGGVYTDASGNGNTLTASGNTSSVAGHDGGASAAVKFIPNAKLYRTNANCVGLNITGSISISFWVYWFSGLGPSSFAYPIVTKYGAAADYGYKVQLNTSNKIEFVLSNDGTAETTATGATALSANTWYHVVCVYDGTDMRVYLNGSLDVNGSNNPKTYSSGIYNSTGEFDLAVENTSTHYCRLQIDDVAVWNAAKTEADAFSLFQLTDDFATTPSVSGVVKDRAGTAINCSTYPVRICVYPKNNQSTAVASTTVCKNASGTWSLGRLTASTKYLVTFELLEYYDVLSYPVIAGAEFMTAA